jgi:FMN phosphatase YigB (HAD superfamily)
MTVEPDPDGGDPGRDACQGGAMGMIKAVVFDIGGVLEKVDDASGVRERSRLRTGLTEAEFEARRASVDPHDLMITGGMDEATYRRRNADAFGWDDATADAFLADFWDWYCGELDTELAVFLDDSPPCVEGARAVGMRAVVHLDTPTSIAAVTTLLARR